MARWEDLPVGDRLYAQVVEIQPELAPKLTGMLLSLGEVEGRRMLEDADLFEARLVEALQLLDVQERARSFAQEPAAETQQQRPGSAAARPPQKARAEALAAPSPQVPPVEVQQQHRRGTGAVRPPRARVEAPAAAFPQPPQQSVGRGMPKDHAGAAPVAVTGEGPPAQAPVAAPSGALPPGGRSSPDDGCVPGLSAWLDALQLSTALPKARAWVEEMGACNLEEVIENLEDFVDALELKPLEVKRLQRGAAEVAVSIQEAIGSELPGPPVPVTPSPQGSGGAGAVSWKEEEAVPEAAPGPPAAAQGSSSSTCKGAAPRLKAWDGDLEISWLGMGTWAWGNDKWGYGGFDRSYNEQTLRQIVPCLQEVGVRLVDTAPTYGQGLAERLLGEEMARSGAPDVVVATKYFPRPRDRDVRSAMLEAARQSQRRLGENSVGLFQIHKPGHPTASLEEQADALASVVAAGLTWAVGLCNFSLEEALRVRSRLLTHGVPLASVQVEFSLLRQYPQHSGLLDECAKLGIVVFAYSPLGMGRLTGKEDLPWSEGTRPFGSSLSGEPRRLAALLEALQEVGAAHGRTPTQVALNWVISRGAVPIPGAKTAAQARENAGALGWQMSPEESEMLANLGAAGGTSDFQHG